MKKRFAMLLALILLVVCLGASAESTDYSEYFDYFRSQVGDITFTMPFAPTILHDVDLIRDERLADLDMIIGWQNKVQLHCSDDEFEIQIHIADLTPAMADAAQRCPELDEQTRSELALQDFVMLSLSFTGAQSNGQDPRTLVIPAADGRAAVTQITLAGITYDDMPETPYRAVAYLDAQNMAVLVMGSEGACLDAVLAEFGPVSPEQAAQITARLTPQEEIIGALRFTFPAQCDQSIQGLSRYWDCFTRDYHLIEVECMPVDLGVMMGLSSEDGGVPEEMLLSMAKYAGEDFAKDGSYQCTAELLLPGVAMLQIVEADVEWGEPMATWALYTSTGIYSIGGEFVDDVLDFVHSIALAEAE